MQTPSLPLRHPVTALWGAVVVLSLQACGGGETSDQHAEANRAEAASSASVETAAQVLAAESNTTVTIVASGTPAKGEFPRMALWVDGRLVDQVTVNEARPYTFLVNQGIAPGARLDVVYANDGVLDGEDRNLRVESVSFQGQTLKPTDPGVVYDRGDVDGLDVIPGQAAMDWNGALRFKAPGGRTEVKVWAAGLPVNGTLPVMELRVDGRPVARRTVAQALPPGPSAPHDIRPTYRNYLPYVFAVPQAIAPGARLELVHVNASTASDSNLSIRAVQVLGRTLYTAPVSGAPVPLEATTVPNDSTRLTVMARGTSAAGVDPLMEVSVDGQVVDRVPVKAATDWPYTFVVQPGLDPTAPIGVAYVNDAVVDGQDRNLWVESLNVKTDLLYPELIRPGTDKSNVFYHLGPVLDVNVIPGQAAMNWNGTLMFYGNANGVTPRMNCYLSPDVAACNAWMAAQKKLALAETP